MTEDGHTFERVVTGRRMIHERDLAVAGYEYVLGTVDTAPDGLEGAVSSHDLLVERGPELGRLLGGLRAFCSADRDALLDSSAIALPADSVVEVDSASADLSVLDACRQLAGRGLTIALRGMPTNEHADALLDVASIVRIDAPDHCRDELAAIVEAARPHGVELLAANIETFPQLHHVRRLEFDLVQGPAVQQAYASYRAVARPASISQLQVAVQILGSDLDFDEIESLLRPEPHLAYQVIRLASLGRIGETRRSINTIHDALVAAGNARVQHWIALLSAFPADPYAPDRIFETLMRAGACEYLAERHLGRESARMGFAAGTLSSFADLLDPRGSSVSELALSDDLREASFGDTSPLAQVVRDVIDHQSGTRHPRKLSGLTSRDLDAAFAAAFLWTVEATASLD